MRMGPGGREEAAAQMVHNDPNTVTGLSSMATRAVLADLAARVSAEGPAQVRFESAGGVDVARRIREGEQADLVVLSERAVEQLDADGLVVSNSVRPLFVSEAVIGAAEGAAEVDVSTVDALRSALAGAGRIGYSTGPSGLAVLGLLDTWGLRERLADRLVQARPGVSVASMVADGKADLGIQQRSEFAGVAGVRVLGPMPAGAEIVSTFTAAVLALATDTDLARCTLAALAAPTYRDVAQQHGLQLLE